MENTIVSALRDYFFASPLMTGGFIHLDCLPEEGMAVAVDADPATEVVKWYTDGSSIRTYRFVIRSGGTYAPDVMQSVSNSGYFESLADWLQQQAKQDSLPQLPQGRQAQSVTLKSAGPRVAEQQTEGVYEIQGELQYYQEA